MRVTLEWISADEPESIPTPLTDLYIYDYVAKENCLLLMPYMIQT
jgi:hypothetical protein